MKNWDELFGNLPDTEKDKIALLRVMECANGCIQYAFRDNKSFQLSLDDTRKAMKFSMSCMKTMTIPLKEELITFAYETEKLCREIRDLYISAFKNGNEKDYNEFMNASGATVNAVGKERLVWAKEILEQNITDIPPQALDWGVSYLMQFLK
jgi:hypothetical protein